MKISKIKKQLKNESRKFVPNIKNDLYQNLGIENNKTYNRYFKFKPYLLLVPTILILFIGIYFNMVKDVTNISNTFITIDINPSIEVEINQDDTVISIRALNSDAIILLDDETQYISKNIFDVINLIINKASQFGYLNNESQDVVINVINDNQTLENKVKNKIIEKYQQSTYIKILTNEEFRELAKENNISLGKMKLIYDLLQVDPSMTIEKAKSLSVQKLNERIRNYHKEEIVDYIGEYKNKINDLKSEKNLVYNSHINKYTKALQELMNMEKLIEQNKYDKFIEIKINNFVKKYMFGYEIVEGKEYDEILKELKTYIHEQNSYIMELIENNYSKQIYYYNSIIKEEGVNKIEDYHIISDFSIINNIIENRYLNEQEKDFILLIDELNIMLNYLEQKNNTDENLIYDMEEKISLINELVASEKIGDNLINSKFYKNLLTRYENFKEKK